MLPDLPRSDKEALGGFKFYFVVQFCFLQKCVLLEFVNKMLLKRAWSLLGVKRGSRGVKSRCCYDEDGTGGQSGCGAPLGSV